MANNIYMTINGKNQGGISDGCSSYKSLGNKYQASHTDEILVIAVSFDISRSQNLTHGPVSITKYVDKSTPLLITAVTNNEVMDCEIDYYRTSDAGAQEKYMTILLRNASIINFSQTHANSLMQNDALPSETLTLRYESITCNHIMASTSGYSIASTV
ncbi:Hcp family type VI secretion system effector [Morganella morganii]|uniref:Hcp family type VI secretion system effector n=1 Tax=Morganella morganii TaxID=582 RepID=UPI002368B26B|nr:Hcp family type VI secretion system effector [Morganella morganii]